MHTLYSGPERMLRDITDFIFVEDPPQESDIIFTPGAMTPEHAERAAELYRQHYAPYVLPSGRFSITLGHPAPLSERGRALYPGEYRTEWDFLRTVLILNGVPEQSVLREDQATYTWENARFSRQVTDKMGLNVKKALLCVKPYHARRALAYYQTAFPEAEIRVCPAKNSPITRDNWHRSILGHDKVLGEMRRMGDQTRQQLDLLLDLLPDPKQEEKP